jgi:hypothetical protein
MSPLQGHLTVSDQAVLEKTGGHPQRLLKLGRARLTALIVKISRNHLGEGRALEWLAAARCAQELYDAHPGVALDDLAAEVQSEIRLLQATEKELSLHEQPREQAYLHCDPDQLARSLPGLAAVGGPVVRALLGPADRFAKGSRARSFTGLAPKTSETGESERKGQPISKAGPNLLRVALVRAADTARKEDPQLAHIYYVQMVERGAPHIKALCVVAAQLAERAWAVLRRGTPYQLRDVDGRPLSREQAKAIVADRYTVPEDVRRRRRSKKSRRGGKAPQQVLKGHAQAGARGATHTRRPSPTPSSDSRLTHIKQVLPTVVEQTNATP